jgi:hypothetical protein
LQIIKAAAAATINCKQVAEKQRGKKKSYFLDIYNQNLNLTIYIHIIFFKIQ